MGNVRNLVMNVIFKETYLVQAYVAPLTGLGWLGDAS